MLGAVDALPYGFFPFLHRLLSPCTIVKLENSELYLNFEYGSGFLSLGSEDWSSIQEGDLAESNVTWVKRIRVPQDGDPDFGIPFCTIPGMVPSSVPDEIHLLNPDGEEMADDRKWQHHNVLGEDEMGDLPRAIGLRLESLGNEYDLIAVGDSGTPEACTHIALFMARKDA